MRCVEEALGVPLGWKRPRMIFVNSMADLFHERVPFEFVDRVFAVMALCPRHTFQVLTKRPERAAEYFARLDSNGYDTPKRIEYHMVGMPGAPAQSRFSIAWPLPNVWLLASCENQAALDARVPPLLNCPAAVRGISAEPLLGPITLRHLGLLSALHPGGWWVIGGGESGSERRTRLEDLMSLRDQCAAAGVPFFLKQLGSRTTLDYYCDDDGLREWAIDNSSRVWNADGSGGHYVWSEMDGQPRPGSFFELRLGRKGGDWATWPEQLRVRQMPIRFHAVAEGRL